MATYAESMATAFGQFQAGKLEEAERACSEILHRDPEQAEALHLLGVICHKLGKRDMAIDYLNQAIARNPSEPSFYNNFGAILHEMGSHAQAALCLRKALALKPDLANGHYNLGMALYHQGKFQEAVESYRKALHLHPSYAEAYNNLGMAHKEQDQLDEALQCFAKAIQIDPRMADADHNTALIYLTQGQVGDAIQHFQRAIQLRPRYPEAYCGLGVAYQRQGKLDQMMTCYEEALRVAPEHVDAHFKRSVNRLLLGDFERGWEEYEWRWKRTDYKMPAFEQPVWDGGPLTGKTILLHAEQGLGDTLQFIRYAPLVKERGGFVVVQCQAPLVQLLSRSPGMDRLIARGDPLPDFDCHVPLLGLPRIFETSLATVPAEVPYIFADPELVEFWRRELSKYNGFKIGICWQGNPDYPDDCARSTRLIHFAPLAQLNGVQLLGLQKGVGSEQLRDMGDDFPIVDLGSHLDESSGAFMDTAAVMMNLDLVIAPNTAIAHLAGALGLPVWVALPFLPDWRFMLDREDSPWYSTMRLFRQAKPEDWEGVFEQITETLRECLARVPCSREALGPRRLG